MFHLLSWTNLAIKRGMLWEPISMCLSWQFLKQELRYAC